MPCRRGGHGGFSDLATEAVAERRGMLIDVGVDPDHGCSPVHRRHGASSFAILVRGLGTGLAGNTRGNPVMSHVPQ